MSDVPSTNSTLASETQTTTPRLFREVVVILPRRTPKTGSHFYCLTSEGPKALYDQEVFEYLVSDDEILVEFCPGDIWAYPSVASGPLASRLDDRLKALVRTRSAARLHQTRQRQARRSTIS
ncbi:MAG: hypothetical protein ACFBZ8_05325 [Opitutales bacterium]